MKVKLSEFIRVAMFVIFGAAITYVVYSSLTKLSVVKHDGYRIKAMFNDIKQLQIGDDVRLAGVRIGSLIDTYLDNDLAVTVLYIENKYKVPVDSTATILMSGLLGANYISILPGNSSEDVSAGEFIKTQATADLSSVLQRFSKIGKKLDNILGSADEASSSDAENKSILNPIGNFSSLVSDLGSFFNENREKLNSIISNTDTVTSALASGDGTIAKLINERGAYDELMGTMGEIKRAASSFDKLIAGFYGISDQIKSGDGVVSKLLYDKQMSDDLAAILKNIKSFSEKLNSPDSSLGKFISDDSLYIKAESAIEKVEKATDSITNAGPITAVGAAASALF